MTISSDILGRSPALYWKLDDASGPAASDSSGNGHPGVYGGTFTLHQYGVEPGTYAAQFGAGGGVSCTNMAQAATSAFSIVWYMSYTALTSPADAILLSHGGSGANAGWEFHVNNTSGVYVKYWSNSISGGTFSAQATPVWNRWWHAWCLTWNGGNTFAIYVDGTSLVTSVITGSLLPLLSGHTFAALGGYPAVISHVAYYHTLLSTADITAIGAYRYDWPFGPMVNVTWPSPPAGASVVLNPGDPVIVDINDDLDDIHNAVIHDYSTGPPG